MRIRGKIGTRLTCEPNQSMEGEDCVEYYDETIKLGQIIALTRRYKNW